MDYNNIIKTFIDEYNKSISETNINKLIELSNDILNCGVAKNTFFIAGNGGSAATGSHLVIDILKTSGLSNPPVCINLSDNIPSITAIGNDIGYNDIFSLQIEKMGKEGDILFVITGSGNSPNIINAVKVAKGKGMKTWGLLGFDGGKVKNMLDDYILVPSYDYGIVEGAHSVLLHILVRILKKGYSK